jgi:hypothetical protein
MGGREELHMGLAVPVHDWLQPSLNDGGHYLGLASPAFHFSCIVPSLYIGRLWERWHATGTCPT